MSEVEDLETRILNLPQQDRIKLRDWFLQLDDDLWDQQIASDFNAGKFQGLMDRARKELKGPHHDGPLARFDHH